MILNTCALTHIFIKVIRLNFSVRNRVSHTCFPADSSLGSVFHPLVACTLDIGNHLQSTDFCLSTMNYLGHCVKLQGC